jgi:hypothetical protein
MPTYKIIGGDNKEYGPATAEEVEQWIREGRLGPQSLVKFEETGEWKALSTYPEFAASLKSQGLASGSGAGSPPPADPAALGARLLAETPDLQIASCLARSWRLLMSNFGLIFASIFLVWMIGLVSSFLPLVGMVYWLFTGVFYGGLYLILLNRIRGQPAAVGDVFAGFSIAFAQLMLAGVVSSLLCLIGFFLCLIPGIYLSISWVFAVPLVADKRMEFWSAMELSRKVVSRVWFQVFALVLLAFLPYIIAYAILEVKMTIAGFALMQQVVTPGQAPDFGKLMEAITRMARESMPWVLGIKFILLLNLPFALGALMYAYEDLFGNRTTPTS